MHHPVAAVFWLAMMAFLVAVMATKKPHKVWMKTAMAAVFAFFGVWSAYGMAQINEGMAILFAVVLGATIVWRTFKGVGSGSAATMTAPGETEAGAAGTQPC
jgi:hypothetical protein